MNQETGGGQDFSSWESPTARRIRNKTPEERATIHAETLRKLKELAQMTEELTNKDVAAYFFRKLSILSSGIDTRVIKQFANESFLDTASEAELSMAEKIVEKDELSPKKTDSERKILAAIGNFLGGKKAKFYTAETPGVLSPTQLAKAKEEFKKIKVR